MTSHEHRLRQYLIALGMLCFEVAREPRLLVPFLRILAMVPATIAELRDRERIAA